MRKPPESIQRELDGLRARMQQLAASAYNESGEAAAWTGLCKAVRFRLGRIEQLLDSGDLVRRHRSQEEDES